MHHRWRVLRTKLLKHQADFLCLGDYRNFRMKNMLLVEVVFDYIKVGWSEHEHVNQSFGMSEIVETRRYT